MQLHMPVQKLRENAGSHRLGQDLPPHTTNKAISSLNRTAGTTVLTVAQAALVQKLSRTVCLPNPGSDSGCGGDIDRKAAA